MRKSHGGKGEGKPALGVKKPLTRSPQWGEVRSTSVLERNLLRRRRCPRGRDADMVEPQVEHGPARLLPATTKAPRLGAGLVNSAACGGELERVPDEPALHASGVLLNVELQRQHLAVVGAEGLVRGRHCARQP